MKNNMTCRKTKLAIAALVFALAGIASSASAGSIQETESQVQYPDAQTLLDMYRGGLESGKLDASLKVDAPTLPMLKVFYELLQEQAMTKEQRADLGPLGLSTDKNSKAAWNCRDETILCLAASAAMVELDVVQGLRVLACGSAALGRNQDSPKFTADCLPILNEGSNACSHANVTCGVVAQPMVTASPHAGSTNATNSYVETKTCASAGGHIGGDRIVKIGAKWGTIGGRTRITTLMATSASNWCTHRWTSWTGPSNAPGIVA